MKHTHFTLLFTLGILLSGCTLQKRSIMPGWHIEMRSEGRTSQTTEKHESEAEKDPRSQNKASNDFIPHTSELQRLKPRPTERDPLIPVKALMTQQVKAELELFQNPLEPIHSDNSLQSNQAKNHQQNPTLHSDQESEVPRNIGWIRILLFLSGLSLTSLGLVFILLIGWDSSFIWKAIAFLTGGFFALKWAFTPNSKWGKRRQKTPASSESQEPPF
jgi:hypothetical protein